MKAVVFPWPRTALGRPGKAVASVFCTSSPRRAPTPSPRRQPDPDTPREAPALIGSPEVRVPVPRRVRGVALPATSCMFSNFIVESLSRATVTER